MGIENKLKDFFRREQGVRLSFLFGSYVKGNYGLLSDTDIAVYLNKERDADEIWTKLEVLLKRNVDLLILNRASPIIAWDAVRTGIPLKIKDRKFFIDYLLKLSGEAEDFRTFTLDALELKLKRRHANK
ncbi:MAG: nucleotidyltransferase domain-containing protein [Candidatus Edwardsbacteria bacterium]